MAREYTDLPEQLRDKQGSPLRILLTPDDITTICSFLTRRQPPGGDKATPDVVGRLLLSSDTETIEQTLLAGLRHQREWRKVDIADVKAMLEEAILDREMQYEDLRRPFLRAWRNCGLAQFDVFIKLLDKAEESDEGKAPTTTSSPTTSSMRSSAGSIEESRPASAF